MSTEKKSKLKLVISLILIAIASFYIYSYIIKRKNIHLIANDGQSPSIYRSAQLSPKELEALIKDKDIAIVLNLRGESKKKWYVEEQELCSKAGVEYYAYGFSESRPPDRERFLNILSVLDKAKTENKNLLVHCYYGADRSGLLSAVSQIYLYNFDIDKAMKESFHWYYGHPYDPNGILEGVIEQYRPYSQQMSSREWIDSSYDRELLLSKRPK